MVLQSHFSGFQNNTSLDRGCLDAENGGVYMSSRTKEACALIQGALTAIKHKMVLAKL